VVTRGRRSGGNSIHDTATADQSTTVFGLGIPDDPRNIVLDSVPDSTAPPPAATGGGFDADFAKLL